MTKNMIDIKAIVIIIIINVPLASLVILLGVLDHREIPVTIFLPSTLFTLYTVKFVQNPKIKEFLFRKLSQTMVNWKENDYVQKLLSFRFRVNPVGAQNNVP